MDKTLRACIYTRVSTQEQAKEGYSIEAQEARCKAAIESKGWEYAGTFSDPGVSGTSMERQGLRDMLDAVEAGEVDAVVVYKLDRLSRSQRDTLTIIEDVFKKNEIVFLSLNETLDTSTPWGLAMIGILSAFNQMECANITERMTMGRKEKAKSGGYAGGKPPLGYKSVDGELIVVPEEAEIVQLVFALRKKGVTLIGIAEELNKQGYRTRKGQEFKHSSIQNILANEDTYKGHYRYGKNSTKMGQHEAILKK